ncbi:MAG TPA: ribosome maturation factor RimM [Saprospiraceae bacterium]|nr:ribosome maturation factor RimM [Saprospiraceae bacterium]HND88606.1 ribosome maturation factor RimM [Saprospiraceae bacterium]HNG88929.1 ribosome maturation factor RimM [Saprospiraceae bacterium]
MYVTIGHTKKTHGIAGELKAHIEERYLEDFLKNERIFLDVKGTKVPYFIRNVRGGKDYIIHLEDVDTREAAYALQSREMLLRESDLIPDTEREIEIDGEETLQYAHLVGYQIKDQRLGLVGSIEEVLEMPQQEMAFLTYKGREVLIPLHPHLIISIDDEAQTVQMDLPDGLLD